MERVYFDNAATTRPLPMVLNKFIKTAEDSYGNPSSMHDMGLKAELLIKKASKTLAGIINCGYEEILYTSGGTESNNLAIIGHCQALRQKNIITTAVEHPSVLECFKHLEKNGFNVTYLPVGENGLIDPELFKNTVTEETAFVSIMHVNNETGAVQDIEHLARIAKQKNPRLIFHCDAVQSFCKHDINVKKWDVDLLSISSHKIHGLKGNGALYIKKGVRITPLFFGGGQQKNIRPGTENSFGIMAFSDAAEYAFANMRQAYEKVGAIKDYIIKNLDGVIINSSRQASSPYVLNISAVGIKAEVLLHALEEQGIYVSSGSACSSKIKAHSILKAYGKPDEISQSAIRLSFSSLNTLEEAEYFVKTADMVISRLRKTLH